MAASVGEVDLDALVNLDDFERAARAVMDKQDFDYFAGAAESETTMRANAAAFSDVTLWPRCLVDVSDVDISASFPELGLPRLAAPLIAAPVAMQKMAHPGGEPAAARACAARRVGYCASQQATTRVETIAEALETTRRRHPSEEDIFPPPPMWFQLYVFEDRSMTKSLIERAEKAGVAAFAVTVDAPVLGRRERDVRNKFAMRAGMKLENVRRVSSEKTSEKASEHAFVSSNANNAVDANDTRLRAARGPTVVRRRATVSAPSRAQKEIAARVGGRDASLTWSFLEWIKSVTDKPIILKGVTRRDDAAKAVMMGVDALWVSNHGGRQLDGAPATLDALPEVIAGAKEAAQQTRRNDDVSAKKKKKTRTRHLRRRRAPRRRRLEGARAGSRPGGVREAARVGPGVRRGGRRRQSHRSVTRRVEDRRGAVRRSKVGRPKTLSGRRAEARGPAARSKAESPVSESTY